MAAVAKKNRCIGKDMGVPWHIPEDLGRFKRLTMGQPVIMGRCTFYSVINQLGRPLPARRSLVLTRRGPLADYPQIETFVSLEDALAAAEEEESVFIIGGGQVYAESLTLADRMELTIVDGSWEGDTFFPEYEHLLDADFERTAIERRDGYAFETWERRPSRKSQPTTTFR
ncbi:MAG: dihydrofolate reductase [Bacteroidota bacterium]|nr:dihydrofolate reductase [Bacteroidota bacterium]